MFVSKRRYEVELESLSSTIRDLRREYWALREDYDRLLNHLGLVTLRHPAYVELRKAPGPTSPINSNKLGG